MKTILDMIRDNDPEYDPLAAAIEQTPEVELPGFLDAREEYDQREKHKPLHSKGEPDTLTKADYVRAAMDLVYWDGYHGPIRARDWAEQDGRRPYTVSLALEVLAAVSERIEGYSEEVHYDPDTDESVMEETVSARDIRRAVFASVVRIYGDLPW